MTQTNSLTGMGKLIVLCALAISNLLLTVSAHSNTDRQSAAVPQEHTIEIVNFKFRPAELVISPGDSVTWINRDIVPHNVAAPELGFRSRNLKKDERFTLVLSKDLQYVCSLHEAVMQGNIGIAK